MKYLITLLCIGTIVQLQVATPAPAPALCESSCEPIRADLCTNLDNNYSKTRFPTRRFITQDDALLQFKSYSSLVSSNCSSKLAHFLCSYYFPPCLEGNCEVDPLQVGPCQSLCTEVQSECEQILTDNNLTWNFNCNELASSQPCIDAPSPDTSTANPIAPAIDSCQSINNSVCASLHPSYVTSFPNKNFDSQDVADLHFKSFEAILENNCSSKLKILLCSSHYPVCLPDTEKSSIVNIAYPCKQVCNQVKRSCEPLLQLHNQTWPDLLKCENFPSKKDEFCVGATTFDTMMSGPDPSPTSTAATPTSTMATTATVTEPVVSATPITDIGTCELIDSRIQRICGVLDTTYNLTRFPHGEFHTQDEAYEKFMSNLPLINTSCSAEILPLMCYHYFPSCSPDQDELKVPCKAICRKAHNNCEPCFLNNTSLNWPDDIDCDMYLVNKNCVSLKDIVEYKDTFVSQSC